METASLSEIKKELKTLTPQQLQELVTRLAKYKKENKLFPCFMKICNSIGKKK